MSFATNPFAGAPFAGDGAVPASAPTRAELLTSGHYVICAEQHFRTIGSDAEHVLILCCGSRTMTDGTGAAYPGFTTWSTDNPPSYEVAGILDDQIDVLRDLAITDTSTTVVGLSGELGIMIPNGGVYLYTAGAGASFEALTSVQAQRQCGGQIFKLKIGRPEYGYASFITVFQTYAEALELVDIYRMRLRLRDYGRNFAQGLLNVWAGTGGQEGTAELAGEVRARHYGAPRNVTPRLALPTTLTYHLSDRTPTSPIAAVYDGGVALTEDTSGYPFANWAAFQAHTIIGVDNAWVQWQGWIRLLALPLGVPTADFADVTSMPAIIRTMLEEAGAPADTIVIVTEDYDFGADNSRSEAWQAVAEMLATATAQEYVSAQENVIDAVDRIARNHGFSRYHDRDGRICFDILDYRLHTDAVAGVDYTVLEAGDSIDVRPQSLPGTLWPPRFRDYVLYDRNRTVMQQNQIFPDATDAFRQKSVVEGFSLYRPDVTPATSPVKLALPSAVDPPRCDTCLIDVADATILADWFQTRSSLTRTTAAAFLSQRRMYQINLPLATGYDLPFFRAIKLHAPGYWPDNNLDLIAQMPPPSEDWVNGRMTFLAYAYGFAYPSFLMSATELGSSIPQGGPLLADTGNPNYAYLLRDDFIYTINISDKFSPVEESFYAIINATYIMAQYSDYLAIPAVGTIYFVDKSTPSAISPVSDIGLFLSIYALRFSDDGNFIYAVTAGSTALKVRLYIIGTSVIASPVQRGYVEMDVGPIPPDLGDDPNVTLTVLDASTVFVGLGDVIRWIDVTDPDAPYVVGATVDEFAGLRDLVCSGGRLYGALSDPVYGGLAVFDPDAGSGTITLSSLTASSGTQTIIDARRIVIGGGYAFLGCGSADSARIVVVDIGGADGPAIVTSVTGSAAQRPYIGPSAHLDYADGYVYASTPRGYSIIG